MMVLDSIDGRTLGYYVGKRGDLIGIFRGVEFSWRNDGHVMADFRCPGTRGHALDQVRKVWSDQNMSAAYRGGLPRNPWAVTHGEYRRGPGIEPPPDMTGETESEAILAAREAAPE